MSEFQKENYGKSKEWLLDGTFKSVPDNFDQLKTIMFLMFEECFLLVIYS